MIATSSSRSTGVHVDSGLIWRVRPHAFALRLISSPSAQELLGGGGVDCRRGRTSGSRSLDLHSYTPRTLMMPMPFSNPGRCYVSAYVTWGKGATGNAPTDGRKLTVQLLMR